MSIFTTLSYYFQYDFVIYATVTAVLVGLCASLLGVTLVLKRFSHIGDGLSHVAFGAMAVASAMKLADHTPLTMLITTVCAVIILHLGENAKIKGDATIAMLSVGALALGYFIINMFGSSANVSGDVCSTLFGATSILTLTASDVIFCAIATVVVVVLFVICYNKIFAVTFDENFSKAINVKASGYNLLIAIMTAVIIVIAMNLVGSLLITALLIFPAVSAMRVFRSYLSVTICSVVIGVVCALVGVILSILISAPVGSTIVLVDIVAFGLFTLAGRVLCRD